jgi:hypothetical protein
MHLIAAARMELQVHKDQLVLPDLLEHWDSQVQQGPLVQLERRALQVRKVLLGREVV